MNIYKLTVSPMGQGFIDKSHFNEVGLSYDNAISKMMGIADSLNIKYDLEELQVEGNHDIGGIGYDYRIEVELMTYDIIFNDDNNSNNMGFTESIEYCKNYINTHNGSNHSYFANYKGGTVQVRCQQTEEIVFETSIL